jgi:HD-GYP domain-containing protein (c-di-GMP phosphodiesterase class II)
VARRPVSAVDRRPPRRQLVASEEAFLGSHVRALTVALATKDTYTEEHTRCVAMLAVRVGEELGLAPERAAARAGGSVRRYTTSATSSSLTRS